MRYREVYNEEFYHIHRENWHSNQWTPGHKISVSYPNHNYYFTSIINQPWPPITHFQEDYHLIDYLHKIIPLARTFTIGIDPHTLNLDQRYELLSLANHLTDLLSKNIEHFEQSLKMVRELIFETIRKERFPSYPSRLNCLWLCEKSDLNTWWNEFIDKKEKLIFKVSAKGKILQADGSLINHNFIRFSDFKQTAFQYWNGDENTLPEKRLPEILFEGELEILCKFQNLDDLMTP